MAVVRNKTIKEAKNEVEYLTGDEEVKRINELKDKWERDRVSEMNYLKSIAHVNVKIKVQKNVKIKIHKILYF